MRSDGADEDEDEQQRLDAVKGEEAGGSLGRIETWQAVKGEPEKMDGATAEEQSDVEIERIQERVQ